jgi:hypothetical protein
MISVHHRAADRHGEWAGNINASTGMGRFDDVRGRQVLGAIDAELGEKLDVLVENEAAEPAISRFVSDAVDHQMIAGQRRPDRQKQAGRRRIVSVSTLFAASSASACHFAQKASRSTIFQALSKSSCSRIYSRRVGLVSSKRGIGVPSFSSMSARARVCSATIPDLALSRNTAVLSPSAIRSTRSR